MKLLNMQLLAIAILAIFALLGSQVGCQDGTKPTTTTTTPPPPSTCPVVRCSLDTADICPQVKDKYGNPCNYGKSLTDLF